MAGFVFFFKVGIFEVDFNRGIFLPLEIFAITQIFSRKLKQLGESLWLFWATEGSHD